MAKQIYQKYEIITKKDTEASETLYYLSHEMTPVSDQDSNLSPAINYTMGMEKNRLILIVPSLSIGYQAASILSAKLAEYHVEYDLDVEETGSTKEDDFEYDLENDLEDELFESDLIYQKDDLQNSILCSLGIAQDNRNVTDSTPVSPYNFRMVKQTPFDQPVQEEETAAAILMQPSNLLPDYPEKNVLLLCSKKAQSASRMEEFLDSMLDKNLILLIKENETNSDFIENLQFKYHFDVLKFKKPSLEQETAIFQKLLKKRGCMVTPRVNLRNIVQSLITYRDYHYEEADLERFAEKMGLDKTLQEQDFSFYYYKKHRSGAEDLQELIGQEEIKRTISRLVINQIIDMKRQQELDMDIPNYSMNFAFLGKPGTGKTETARILSRILHENGIRNGKFVEAGREDLVAKYLGQTSPKITALFKKGKGGVIFIDEVDSLLSNDHYAQEAVSALVRHMENNQDTTIIFATYPDQMKAFFELNPGLTSRISKQLFFKPYSNEELWEIFKLFAERSGYKADPDCKKTIIEFIETTREREKKNFGNARVMRKLFQEAKECSAFRIYNSSMENLSYCITASDIKTAVNYQTPVHETVRVIGFAGGQTI